MTITKTDTTNEADQNQKDKWPCDDPTCVWCAGSLPMRHPYSGPPIPCTTICICADGKVYNLGKGEYPPSPPMKNGVMIIKEPKHKLVNAYTCTMEEADKLKAKAKRK